VREIAWDDVMSVGVDEIDDDHRKLINTFNLLSRAVVAGDPPAYLDALLDELINCTVWHFSHEERLMVRYGYDQAAEHKAEHRALIESAQQLRDEIAGPEQSVSEAHIAFLERWLTEHIFTADMRLGDRLYQKM
jgi:hemerythrin